MAQSYNKLQLEQAWIRNGGNKSKAAMAAAIAMAESKGNREPEGDVGLGGKGATSFGAYQVHTPAHPEYSPQLLVNNLDYSTKAAIKISNNGADWGAWTTYKTGAYKQYLTKDAGLFFEFNPLHIPSPINPLKAPNPLGAGEALVEGVEGAGGIGGAISGAGSALSSIAEAFGTLEEWLADPLRILKLAGGSVLVVMGLHTLVRSTPAAPNVAATAAPAKGTLKLARKAAEAAAVA